MMTRALGLLRRLLLDYLGRFAARIGVYSLRSPHTVLLTTCFIRYENLLQQLFSDFSHLDHLNSTKDTE